MSRTFRDRSGGFAIATALFLLVILALLGVFAMSVSGMHQAAQALDMGGVRAYQGARAGIEWALLQVLDADSNDAGLSASPPVPPACFASTTLALGATFDNLSATVTCSRTTTTEANRQVAVYSLVSTVSGGGAAFPVSREVRTTVSRCTDPGGTPPRYACP
jgi:MSHA biogenesis protein MshP